jgi:branched-chain amino acid transport system substrate-binding protein
VVSKADLVYYPLSVDNSTLGYAFLLALRTQLPKIAIMGGDGLVSAPLPADTARLEGIIATQAADAQQLDTADPFSTAYIAAYGEPPSPVALLSYESGGVLLAALRKVDPPTRDGVLVALQNLDDYNGAFGRWRFDRNGDTTVKILSVWQLRNGRWQLVQVLR